MLKLSKRQKDCVEETIDALRSQGWEVDDGGETKQSMWHMLVKDGVALYCEFTKTDIVDLNKDYNYE